MSVALQGLKLQQHITCHVATWERLAAVVQKELQHRKQKVITNHIVVRKVRRFLEELMTKEVTTALMPVVVLQRIKLLKMEHDVVEQ